MAARVSKRREEPPAPKIPAMSLDAQRVYLLSRGLGVSGQGAIVYQHITGPLVDARPAHSPS